jgi:hypothetical protein
MVEHRSVFKAAHCLVAPTLILILGVMFCRYADPPRGAHQLDLSVSQAELMQWAGCSASSGATSLANAVVVARAVLEYVDMHVVGMRFVGAWAEHGRKPAATRFANRIDCGTDITGVSVRPDGEGHAVREFETHNICRNSERVGAQLPAFGMIAVAALIAGDMNGLQIRPEACSEDRSHDFAQPMGQRLSETARNHGLFRKSDAGPLRALDRLHANRCIDHTGRIRCRAKYCNLEFGACGGEPIETRLVVTRR